MRCPFTYSRKLSQARHLMFLVLLLMLHLASFTKAQTVQDYIREAIALGSGSEIQPHRAIIARLYKAYRLAPHHEEVNLRLADAYLQEENLDSALFHCDKAIEANQSQGYNFSLRAKIYVAKLDWENALKSYDQAIALVSTDAVLYAERADVYVKIRNFKKAEQDIYLSNKYLDNNPYANSVKALMKAKQGYIEQATSILLHSIEQAKVIGQEEYSHVIAKMYFELANIEASNKRHEEAIANYQSSLRYEKGSQRNYQALYKLSIQYLAKGSWQYAYENADKVIKNNRRFMDAYLVRAIAQKNMGKEDSYAKDIAKYIASLNTAESYAKGAQIVSLYTNDLSLLNKALEWSNKSVSHNDNAENNYVLANIYLKLAKITEAQKYAKKGLELARAYKVNYLIQEYNNLLAVISQRQTDITKPTIKITSPIQLMAMRGIIPVYVNNTFIVAGEACDESGIEKVIVNDQIAKYYEHRGTFEAKIVLLPKHKNKDGSYKITVSAIDLKGNTETITFDVLLENEHKAPKDKTLVEKGETEKQIKKSLSGRNYAILFATNEYKHWSKLHNPIRDAEAVAKELRDLYGFETEVVKNPTKTQILDKLKEYASKKYDIKDQLLVFFAGHGHYDSFNKDGFIVTTETLAKEDDKHFDTYLPYSRLRPYISAIPSHHTLLISDVCFGGTIDPLVAMRGEKSNYKNIEGLDIVNRIKQYRTFKYITSGGKEYVADGLPGSHSPFARRLLEALRSGGGGDSILNLKELYSFFEDLSPTPLKGTLDNSIDDPGSDFFFIAK